MKYCFGYILALILLSNEVKAQNRELGVSSDSLEILELFDGYKVSLQREMDSLRSRIEVFKQDSEVAVIWLPINDLEVKNFSVEEIEKTKSGFLLMVSWGGGKDFYSRVYYFDFNSNNMELFLTKVDLARIEMGSESEVSRKKVLETPILVQRLKLVEFMENE